MRVPAGSLSVISSSLLVKMAFLAGFDCANRDRWLAYARLAPAGSDSRRRHVRHAKQDHRRLLRSLSRLKDAIK